MLGQRYKKLLEILGIERRDVMIFLTSLLLAFSIWLIHNLSQKSTFNMSVPTVVVSNIDGREAESSTSTTISARCVATGYQFIHSSRVRESKPVRVYVDPQYFSHVEGDIFSISASDLALYVQDIYGEDVRLEKFSSLSFNFRFNEESCKKVPVQPVCLVKYRSQYMARQKMQVNPDSVIIYGDPLYLENIDRIFTQTISLNNVSNSRTGNARLEIPRNIRLSETEVSYFLDVTRFFELKRTVKIELRNVPSNKTLSVFPSTAEVRYRCAFPINHDPTESVSVYVDYKDFVSSVSGKCVPRVSKLPASVLDWSITPEVFECVENVF